MRWLSKRLAHTELEPQEAILVVGPYDQVILTTDRKVPRATLDRIRDQFNAAAASDSKVIVLEAGLKITAIRQKPGVKAADVDTNELLA